MSEENQQQKQTQVSLEDLIKIHDFEEVKVISPYNDLQTLKCRNCGLMIKKGAGWYIADNNQKLAQCISSNPVRALDQAKKLYKTKSQQVIFVETAKFVLIALDYAEPIVSKLSQQHKTELMQGSRRQISNKSYGIAPFSERIIAVSFRDHYIKDSFRFFKGNKEECLAFLDFYITQQPEFNPKEFVYCTKFGTQLKYLDISKFKESIRK